MDVAAVLFGRGGFEAASLNDLAAEAGISKAGIYHYFRTKQDVYDAIIVTSLRELFETVSAAVAAVREPDQQLLAFMTAHAEYFERHYWAFRCMLVSFSSMSAPLSRHDAVASRESYEHLLRDIVAEGVRQGTFREVNPAATGRAVLSMLNWMARWFQPGGPSSAAEVAREYYDLLLNGLRR